MAIVAILFGTIPISSMIINDWRVFQGVRARNLHLNTIRNINATRVIILLTYVTAMCLTLALGVIAGVSHPSEFTCQAAIINCLVFYVLMKILMYVFLVERAHAIRGPRVRRLHDWVWVIGIAVIAGGFGAVAVDAFIFPLHQLRDGACHIGIPARVTIPLVTYDVCINIALTALFIYFLRPLIRFRFTMLQMHVTEPEMPVPRHISRTVDNSTSTEKRLSTSTDEVKHGSPNGSSASSGISKQAAYIGWAHPSTRYEERHNSRMEVLLKKSLIGSFLVLIPTVVNMVLLACVRGTEQSWLCFMLCNLDGEWRTIAQIWDTS
jgi:hypothetical protein